MVHTVWPEDIGCLRAAEPPGCDWCGEGRYSAFFTTQSNQLICDDCVALAREVRSGLMSISHIETASLAADLRAPLRLRLCVRYTDEGQRWLAGVPADEEAGAIMEDLGLYANDNTLGISGTSRADLGQETFCFILEDYAESLEHLLSGPANHDWDPDEEELYRESVTRYRRRLRPCTCAARPSVDQAQEPQDEEHEQDDAQR